jgi:hypothetical protein
MKKLLFVVVALGGLVVAGVAISGPGGPSGPTVAGGGHFTQCLGSTCLTRDFSVDAHRTGSHANGTLYYGENSTPRGLVGRIDCMEIVGSDSVVGGIVTATSGSFATVGLQFVLFQHDRGSPGMSVTPDESSLLYTGDSTTPVITIKGGRTTCPPPDSKINTEGFSPIVYGDVAVTT